MAFFDYEYQWLAYAGAIAGSIIAFTISGLLAVKNKTRQSRNIKLLQVFTAFLGMAAVFDWTLFTVKGTFPGSNDAFNYISLGSYLSFSMSAIGNVYLLQFIINVFYEGEKGRAGFAFLAGAELAVGPALVALFFLRETGIVPGDDFPLVVLLVHVACSLVIYSLQAANAFKVSSRIATDRSKKADHAGLTTIGWSGIILFIAIIVFVSHEVIVLIPVREYWTVTAGWLLGAVAGVLVYIGYVMPDWFKRRWTGK